MGVKALSLGLAINILNGHMFTMVVLVVLKKC